MTITRHGIKTPFFKGVTTHHGRRLVFFGTTIPQVIRKYAAWEAQQEKA